MLYLILAIGALSLGAEAQTCNCSVDNLPQCLLQNATATNNTTAPLLCLISDVYNLVNRLLGGTVNNQLAVVLVAVTVVLQVVKVLGIPVDRLINFVSQAISACKLELPGFGNGLTGLLARLPGLVLTILAAVTNLRATLIPPIG